jgi:hypothetical protein
MTLRIAEKCGEAFFHGYTSSQCIRGRAASYFFKHIGDNVILLGKES